MSRKIKFRAWDKLAKRMIYANHHISLDFNGVVHNLQNGAGGDDFELMQSTSLKDKNGKEIYEGDILASEANEKPCNYIVKWGETKTDYCGFILNPVMKNPPKITFHIHDFQAWMTECFLIIGNTVENPELLPKT